MFLPTLEGIGLVVIANGPDKPVRYEHIGKPATYSDMGQGRSGRSASRGYDSVATTGSKTTCFNSRKNRLRGHGS